MTKPEKAVMLVAAGVTHDLMDGSALPLAALNLPALRDLYNGLCLEAARWGVEASQCKTINAQHRDHPTAERRIAALHAAIVTAVKVRRPNTSPGSADVISEKKAEDMSPGLRRLLDSGRAEEIRQNTLADQERAKKEMAKRSSTKTTTARKTTAEKKAPAPRSKGIYADKATISLLHSGDNPKRGTAAERFKFYRDGMRVGTYIEKVGNRVLAIADLRWDAGKGWIKLNAPAAAQAA